MNQYCATPIRPMIAAVIATRGLQHRAILDDAVDHGGREDADDRQVIAEAARPHRARGVEPSDSAAGGRSVETSPSSLRERGDVCANAISQ